MTIRDVSLQTARDCLVRALRPGDTLILLKRESTPRQNVIVDFAKQGAPNHSLGRYIGPVFGRPYIFRKRGVLLKRGETAEQAIAAVSTALFGRPDQLKAVWA